MSQLSQFAQFAARVAVEVGVWRNHSVRMRTLSNPKTSHYIPSTLWQRSSFVCNYAKVRSECSQFFTKKKHGTGRFAESETPNHSYITVGASRNGLMRYSTTAPCRPTDGSFAAPFFRDERRNREERYIGVEAWRLGRSCLRHGAPQQTETESQAEEECGTLS